MVRHLAIFAACIVLTGCVTATSNLQNPTASEMLLRAHAGERAAAEVNLICKRAAEWPCVPKGVPVAIQVTAGGSLPGGEYAVAAFRAHLAGAGGELVDDPKSASVVIELRLAAAGIDEIDRVLGLPAMTIPGIPGTGLSSAITIPEAAIYSRHERSAVVEMSAIAREAKTGRLISAVGPIWGVARIVNRHLLTGFVWGAEQEHPGIKTSAGGR